MIFAVPLFLLLLADAPVAPAAAAPAVAAPAVPRSGRLEGGASLGRNRPVVGATVVTSAEERPARFYVTTSDARGHFAFDGLADGNYRVEISRDGLERVVKERVGLRFPFRAVVEVTLQGTGAAASPPAQAVAPGSSVATGELLLLRGVVGEGLQAPLADVPIRLIHALGLEDPRAARSGSDGVFEISGLAPGAWTLEAQAVGFLAVRASLALAADAEVEIRLVRQPAGYEPSPLELMPREEPLPPPGLARPPIDLYYPVH